VEARVAVNFATFHRILGKRAERWVLVSWDQDKGAGSVIVGKNMPHDNRFSFANPSHLGRPISSLDGITFYPELRYRGLPVLVWNGWHPESEEPLLGCMLGDVKPMIEAESGVTHAMIVQANDTRSEDEHRWKQVHDRRKAASRKIMQRVVDDGWKQEDRGLYSQYIHVDDLEKIEGPPPEGPF